MDPFFEFTYDLKPKAQLDEDLNMEKSLQQQANIKMKEIQVSSSNNYLDAFHKYFEGFAQILIDQKSIEQSFESKEIDRQAFQTKNHLEGRINKKMRLIQTPNQEKLLANHFVVNKFFQKPQSHSENKFRFQIVEQMKNFEIIQILCQPGRYSKRYTVLNQFNLSFRHCYHLIGLGAFGSVFCSSHQNKKNAIKCLKFDFSDPSAFQNSIQEFFIADLLSSIEVGPKILKTKGFEFVLFVDCLEFQMELCQPVRQITLDVDLKMNMLRMHQLKVIHSDIKPPNVMFSPSYQKNVFLDFGVAEVINEEIWQQTLTKFKGTYEFCSEEMKTLFIKKKQDMLNLYINDKKMLDRTLTEFFKFDSNKTQYKLSIQVNGYSKITIKEIVKQQIIEMKYYLYLYDSKLKIEEDMIKLIKIIKDLNDDENKLQIIKAIEQFSYNFKQSSQSFIQSKFMVQRLNIIENIMAKSDSNFFVSQNIQSYTAEAQQMINRQKFFIKNWKNSEISVRSNLNGTTKRGLDNVQFILFNQNQICALHPQQYFELLLSYVSFTQINYDISHKKKQNAAQVMRKLIEGKMKNLLNQLKYFEIKYQPKLSVVKQQLPNLAFFYGFLLSYCMDDEINDFKLRIMPIVLKECIFMSFMYHLFLKECLQKYYQHLLQMHPNKVITTAIVETAELIYMSEEHFLVTNSPLETYQYYGLRFCLKKILISAFQNIKQKSNSNNPQSRSEYLLLRFWSIFSHYHCWRDFGSFFNTLLLQHIQHEFLLHQDFIDAEYFEKAFQYISLQISERSANIMHKVNSKVKFPQLFPKSTRSLAKKSQSVNIIDFILKIKSSHKRINTIGNLISQFDSIHNLLDLTFYFFLNSRFVESFEQEDYFKSSSIKSLFLLNKESAFINFSKFSSFLLSWKARKQVEDRIFIYRQNWIQQGKKRELIVSQLLQKIIDSYQLQIQVYKFKPYSQGQARQFIENKYYNIEFYMFQIEGQEKTKRYISRQSPIFLINDISYDLWRQYAQNIILLSCIGLLESFPKPQDLDSEQYGYALAIKSLQRIYKPKNMSSIDLDITIKLYRLYPENSLKHLKLRRDTQYFILNLYKFIIQDDKSSQKINNHFFNSPSFRYNQFKSNYLENSPSQTVMKFTPKTYHQNILHIQARAISHLAALLREIEFLLIPQMFMNEKLWSCLKVKRYFRMDRSISKYFYFLFYFLISSNYWEQSFQALAQYFRQVIFFTPQNYPHAFTLISDVFQWLNAKTNFDSLTYSMQLIFYLQKNEYLKQNDLTALISFPIYLNVLFIHQFQDKNPIKWQQILLKVYRFLPQFLSLPKQILSTSNRKKMALEISQQVYQITLRFISAKKQQRKHKIYIRQIVKKLHSYQDLKAKSVSEYFTELMNSFICVKEQFCHSQFYGRHSKLERYREKIKKIFVNILIDGAALNNLITRKNLQFDEIFKRTYKQVLEKKTQRRNIYQLLHQQLQFCKKFNISQFNLYKMKYKMELSQSQRQKILKRWRKQLKRKDVSPQDQFQEIIHVKMLSEDQQSIKQRVKRVKESEQYKLWEEGSRMIQNISEIQLSVYSERLQREYKIPFSALKWLNLHERQNTKSKIHTFCSSTRCE